MPVAAPLIIGAATLGGAAIASGASHSAANAQVQATDQAAQTQEDIFNKQTALQEPFRQGGMAAENRLLTLLGISPGAGSGLTVDTSNPDFGKYAGDFSMKDFTTDPGYQFRLDQGIKALNQSMAARGLGVSGANIKGALNFGQNLASDEYQNAFNRYQINRSNQLNPLQSLMGSAQTSANTLTGAAGQMGQNISDLQTQAGNARASGYVGSANALTNALGQGVNSYFGFQNMNTLNNFLSPYNSSVMSGGSVTPNNSFSGYNFSNYSEPVF